MTRKGFSYIYLSVACAAAAIAPATGADLVSAAGQTEPVTKAESISNFEAITRHSL